MSKVIYLSPGNIEGAKETLCRTFANLHLEGPVVNQAATVLLEASQVGLISTEGPLKCKTIEGLSVVFPTSAVVDIGNDRKVVILPCSVDID